MRLISQVAKEIWQCKDQVRAVAFLSFSLFLPFSLFLSVFVLAVLLLSRLYIHLPALYPTYVSFVVTEVIVSLLQTIVRYEGDIQQYKKELQAMLEEASAKFEEESKTK